MTILNNIAQAAESVAGQMPHDWFGFAAIVFGGVVTIACSGIAAWATVKSLNVNRDNAQVTKDVKKQITNGQEDKNFRTEFEKHRTEVGRRITRIEQHLGIPADEHEPSSSSSAG